MSARVYLSACLCFKDAATYLAEWLAFYSLMGVERFFLYNNESADDFEPVIAPYLARGSVRVDYPGRGVQRQMYDHCLKEYGPSTRWLLFCDDDEFFFPVEDVPLAQALGRYEKHAGVAAAWMLYGSSGHQDRPPGLVLRHYTRRMAYPDRHVKCAVDPARIVRSITIGHQFESVAGEAIVDENEQPLSDLYHPSPTARILRINHYLTKSIAEMTRRRSRIQADTGAVSALGLDEWRRLERTWDVLEDPIAVRYADRVERALALGGGMPQASRP